MAINSSVKRLLGRPVEMFVGKRDGVFHVGDPPNLDSPQQPKPNQKEKRRKKKDKRAAKRLIYSEDFNLRRFQLPDDHPSPGEAGLEELLNDGKIRVATAVDVQAWEDKASNQYKNLNPRPAVQSRMHVGRTYVVLEKITLPDGMFGAHSRSFIVPKSVPLPAGSKGHNSFYLMDGSALGPGAI